MATVMQTAGMKNAQPYSPAADKMRVSSERTADKHMPTIIGKMKPFSMQIEFTKPIDTPLMRLGINSQMLVKTSFCPPRNTPILKNNNCTKPMERLGTYKMVRKIEQVNIAQITIGFLRDFSLLESIPITGVPSATPI